MAYDRSKLSRDIAEVAQKLNVGGREAPTGEVIAAVVDAGICGRGVAQQILSELRKSRTRQDSLPLAEESSEPLPPDVENLVRPFEDLHRAVDEVRASVCRAAGETIEEVKASFTAVVADQGLTARRAAEDGRIQLEVLEASLAEAERIGAEAAAKLSKADAERADLFALMTEAQETCEALQGRVSTLERERDQHQIEADKLRNDLASLRHDLAAARQLEVALREQLRVELAEQAEYSILKGKLEMTTVSLADERARNAEIHAQLVQLVAAVRLSESGTAPASTAPS